MDFVALEGDLFVNDIFRNRILVNVLVVILVYSVPDRVDSLIIKHVRSLNIFRAYVDNYIAPVHSLGSYKLHEVVGRTDKAVRLRVVVFGPVFEAGPKLIAAL